jgi:hypothetical protein
MRPFFLRFPLFEEREVKKNAGDRRTVQASDYFRINHVLPEGLILIIINGFHQDENNRLSRSACFDFQLESETDRSARLVGAGLPAGLDRSPTPGRLPRRGAKLFFTFFTIKASGGALQYPYSSIRGFFALFSLFSVVFYHSIGAIGPDASLIGLTQEKRNSGSSDRFQTQLEGFTACAF